LPGCSGAIAAGQGVKFNRLQCYVFMGAAIEH